MKLKGIFLHNKDDWSTPSEIYKHFTKELGCIDPCPLCSKENNLEKIYNYQNLYINPPYSKIKEWVEFIKKNLENDNIIYLLIPARTDTKYFHELMNIKNTRKELYFIKGRLKFGNSKNSAPFPSVLIKIYDQIYSLEDEEGITTEFINQEDILKIL